MKQSVKTTCLITAMFCVIPMAKYYAQASLQEIVRFDLIGNVEGISQADPGGDINGNGRPDLVFSYWEQGEFDANICIYHDIPDSNPITPLLHYSITSLLHYPLLHYSITPLLHYSITPLLHYSITPLLHYSITPLLHYSLLHYFITS